MSKEILEAKKKVVEEIKNGNTEIIRETADLIKKLK